MNAVAPIYLWVRNFTDGAVWPADHRFFHACRITESKDDIGRLIGEIALPGYGLSGVALAFIRHNIDLCAKVMDIVGQSK